MKSTLQGRIISTDNLEGLVTLAINAKGKVDTHLIAAKDISFNGTIKLKSVISDNMKIGATLYITVSDENPELE